MDALVYYQLHENMLRLPGATARWQETCRSINRSP
jgi:hypothetical protein